jgi:hypothetical protein
MDIELKTYGDLKQLIKSITTDQKSGKLIDKGKSLALDQLLGFIPGASNAKTAYEFIRTAIAKPDTKKTNTWLDKLDIDDNMSKIIDDTVENGFMATMSKAIESESNTKILEPDFNMNQKLVDYLKTSYQGRTVTGIKENNMKKELLKKIIKEEIAKLKQEANIPTPATTTPPAAKPKISGAPLNLTLLKTLDQSIDAVKLTTAIGKVKNNTPLNNTDNQILASVLIAMIKTNKDNLLTSIVNNFKNIEAK